MLSNTKVGFISVVFSEIGGVETWHKSLIPYIKDKVDVKGIVSIQDPHKSIKDLGINWGCGTKDARWLVSQVDTIVIWGDDDPSKFFVHNKPKRVVFVHHGDQNSEWSRDVLKIQAPFATQVVAVNPIVAEQNGYYFIPNGIGEDRIAKTFSPDSKTVLWGHRLSSEKRPQLAVQIAERMNDFKFIFAGNGAMSQWLVDNLPSNSEYVGKFTNLVPYLERSSVFLATPDQEGFGYSVLESVLSGVPVVSSDKGIALDLADKTVSSENLDEWEEAIRSVSGSSACGQSMALATYSHEKFINNWVSFLRKK